MNTNDNFHPGSRMNRATDRAAAAARGGIDAVNDGVDLALNAAYEKLSDVRRHAAPAARQGIDEAKSWVDDRAGRVQQGARDARVKAGDLADQVVDYAREEPVKALLIATAVGGLLIGVVRWLAGSDD